LSPGSVGFASERGLAVHARRSWRGSVSRRDAADGQHLASVVLREPFSILKRIGFVLIVLGAVGIVWGRGGTIGTTRNIGHALFLVVGLA
jgi:hypothetical protein